MTRRPFAATLLATGLLLGAGGMAQAGTTLDRVLARKTLVAVVDPSYPPFTFLNDKNQMDGFDIDISKAVSARLGVALRIDTPSWEVVSAGNWRGRWDICICSMTPDQQKAKVLDFVVPYYRSPVVLVTTAADKALHSARDLTGKRVGVEQGSSYERYLQRDLDLSVAGAAKLSYPFAQLRVAPYASEDLAYQDLALGAGKRLDAVISNYGTAKYRINKLPGRFRIVGQPLYLEPNWVAVDKGDPQWQQKIRTVIAALKSDGTLARISQKWLGEDVTR